MDDNLFLFILFGIIGLVAAAIGPRVRFWGIAIVVAGIIFWGLAFSNYWFSFADGLLPGGIFVSGFSFIYGKVDGKYVLTRVNWPTLIIGIIAVISGLVWVLSR